MEESDVLRSSLVAHAMDEVGSYSSHPAECTKGIVFAVPVPLEWFDHQRYFQNYNKRRRRRSTYLSQQLDDARSRRECNAD